MSDEALPPEKAPVRREEILVEIKGIPPDQAAVVSVVVEEVLNQLDIDYDCVEINSEATGVRAIVVKDVPSAEGEDTARVYGEPDVPAFPGPGGFGEPLAALPLEEVVPLVTPAYAEDLIRVGIVFQRLNEWSPSYWNIKLDSSDEEGLVAVEILSGTYLFVGYGPSLFAAAKAAFARIGKRLEP